MSHAAHSLIWRGTPYRVQRLRGSLQVPGVEEWAVSRSGEFIGTMSAPAHLTPRELAAHCFLWLDELLTPAAGQG
jgi:hypothetical protein